MKEPLQYALLLASLLLITSGCRAPQLPPAVSLANADFADGPVIIQRDTQFYLRYRRALTNGYHTLRLVLDAERRTDGIYYFFYGPLSTPEWGNLIERPMAYDGAGEFARKGRVFWLDPDGTAHPIPVRQEN